MRGTLHFVPAEDAKWMLKLLAPRRLAGDGRRLRQLEIDDSILKRTRQLFQDALRGGKRLSRPKMMELLKRAGINPEGQRGYHDFAGWTGLTLTDARRGLEAIRPALVSEKLDDREYWVVPDAPGHREQDTSVLHLLPGFEEYLLGYKDRSAVLAAEHANKIVPGGNGVFRPIIVVRGQVAGTWKRALRKNAVEITLSFFTADRALNEKVGKAASEYSHFLGLPLASTESNQLGGSRMRYDAPLRAVFGAPDRT